MGLLGLIGFGGGATSLNFKGAGGAGTVSSPTGTNLVSGGNEYWVFLGPTQGSLVISGGPGTITGINCVAIGGGGSGGTQVGGGGGAGGAIFKTGISLSTGTHPIVVGAGGPEPQPYNQGARRGTQGGNTVLNFPASPNTQGTFTAIGGGGGGRHQGPGQDGPQGLPAGGCGGGGGGWGGNPTSGAQASQPQQSNPQWTNYGHPGGAANNNPWHGGGGGGCGNPGSSSNAPGQGAPGGSGQVFPQIAPQGPQQFAPAIPAPVRPEWESRLGPQNRIGGGGGGCADGGNNNYGQGGSGGGGHGMGDQGDTADIDAIHYTGSGGGGVRDQSGGGGYGGHGMVVIVYPQSDNEDYTST